MTLEEHWEAYRLDLEKGGFSTDENAKALFFSGAATAVTEIVPAADKDLNAARQKINELATELHREFEKNEKRTIN